MPKPAPARLALAVLALACLLTLRGLNLDYDSLADRVGSFQTGVMPVNLQVGDQVQRATICRYQFDGRTNCSSTILPAYTQRFRGSSNGGPPAHLQQIRKIVGHANPIRYRY